MHAKLGYSGGEEEYDGRNDRGKTHIVGLWHVMLLYFRFQVTTLV